MPSGKQIHHAGVLNLIGIGSSSLLGNSKLNSGCSIVKVKFGKMTSEVSETSGL